MRLRIHSVRDLYTCCLQGRLNVLNAKTPIITHIKCLFIDRHLIGLDE